MIPATGALVLCGGESRRMGRPKAWLPFGSETLLQRVVRLVGESASPVIVVAAPGQELPDLPDEVAIVRDPEPHLGPLRGLASGLEAMPIEVEFVYATAVDLPFLDSGWIGRLAELIGDAGAAIPSVDGYSHPLSALYRRSAALPAVFRSIDAGKSRLSSLAEILDVRIVSAEEVAGVDPSLRTIKNVNTPEDYETALGYLIVF